jgi:tetratricopeptide (TPR) repeat protein
MIIVAIIAHIFWAILGLIFWIPLLFRVVAAFCLGLIYNMVMNNPEKIEASKASLEMAISFYPKGFQIIQSTLFEKSSATAKYSPAEFKLLAFLGHIFWTIIFWALTISPFMKKGLFYYLAEIGKTKSQYIAKANQSLNIRDTTRAIYMLTKAIERDRFDANLYYKRGLLYNSTFKFNKAADDLESAINLDTVNLSSDANLLWLISVIYAEKTVNYDKAVYYLTRTLKYAPNFSGGYNERGYCYDMKGEKDLALNDYSKAIELNPNSAMTYFNKATILYNKGRKDEACSLIKMASAIGYKEADNYINRYCQ